MTNAVTRRPLANLKILVTRPKHQAQGIADRIRELGGIPILLPAIEIDKGDQTALLKASNELAQFEWLVFTSANGVSAFYSFAQTLPQSLKLAAIGPATAKAIELHYGRLPDLVPEKFISDAIAPAMGDVAGKRILLARADIARKELAVDLRKRGATVTEVVAYTIGCPEFESPIEKPDVVTVTSPSAVRHTLQNFYRMGEEHWREQLPWICIGPITADAARELGCNVAGVGDVFTVEGLIEALLKAVSP